MAMRNEIETLKQIRFWNRILRTKKTRLFHTRFVLRRKKIRQGTFQRYKAVLVVCCNEERHFTKKYLLCCTLHYRKEDNVPDPSKQLVVRGFGFWKCFSKRSTWFCCRCQTTKTLQKWADGAKDVFRLNRGLYGFKNAVNIRNKTIFRHLKEIGLFKMVSAPCIFLKRLSCDMLYWWTNLLWRIKNINRTCKTLGEY